MLKAEQTVSKYPSLDQGEKQYCRCGHWKYKAKDEGLERLFKKKGIWLVTQLVKCAHYILHSPETPTLKFRYGGILVCNPSARELEFGRSQQLTGQSLI